MEKLLSRYPSTIQFLIGLLFGGALVYLIMGLTLALAFPLALGLPFLAAAAAALAVWRATGSPTIAWGIAAAAAAETIFWFYLFSEMGRGLEMFEGS